MGSLQPVERWYLQSLNAQSEALTPQQRQSIHRQAVIGWLQTALLIIVVLQSVFAGFLHVLPPETRSALGFLHRIEWGVYAGIVLIIAQVAVGWVLRLVVTNRFYLLAWRFNKPRVISGKLARRLQIAYLALALLMFGAAIWVRIHGFIFQPTP